MMKAAYFKHYFPIFLVIAIGIGTSVSIQNSIVANEHQKRRTEFETLVSTLTLQLQQVINKQVALTDALGDAISVDINIIDTPHFDKLISRFMESTPGIYGVFVVSPKTGLNDREANFPVFPLQDPYSVLDGYRLLAKTTKIGNRIFPDTKTVITSRILGFEENQQSGSKQNHLVIFIDSAAVFSDVLKGVMPDWLNMVIYIKDSGGQNKPTYSYSNVPGRGITPPDNPAEIDNPHAIYLPGSITANEGALSVLYLPTDSSYFSLPLYAKWGPLSVGMLLSLIVAVYLRTILKRNEIVNSLVSHRTEELLETADSLRQESQERQKLVDELSKSENQMRAVINSVNGMFWERDLVNNRFNFISEHVEELLGYTQEDVLRDVDLLRSRILPEYRDKLDTELNSGKEGDEPHQIEVQVKRSDGRVIWVRIILSLAFKQGQPILVRGVTMDVTRYKKMGEERAKLLKDITQSQQELSSLINSIDGVLWKFNLNPHRYTYVSKQVEHFLGCTPTEVLNNPSYIMERIIPEDVDRVRKQMSNFFSLDTRSQALEFQMRRDDGEMIAIRNIVTPVIENGEVTKFHGVMLDISREKKMQEEHKFLEDQLKQAQKLEAIGQLAAGVAHEINTPTQFVGDNLHYLEDAFSDLQQIYTLYAQLVKASDGGENINNLIEQIRTSEEEIDLTYLFEDIPSSIEQALEGTGRIRDIVKAMKEFSHPGSTNKEKVDLNNAIKSTVTVARNEWKYVAEVETDLAENLPPVEVQPGEFNQVILNIVVNAAHAIENKHHNENSEQLGKIKIHTKQQDDSILINISDTGGGIPEDIKERVFDPFFTTKEVGKGTGQGLAIAYSVIVDKHQGQISLQTTPGEGTTFTIRLPIESPIQDERDEPDAPTAMAS